MVTLGSFTFPEKRTFVQVRTRNVLSRVRKEINLYTLLIRYSELEQLEADLEALEGQLEKFDRREATLSLHEGRYYTGWRRDFQRFVESRHRAASVHLLILTDDRFERSIEEHQENVTLTASGQSVVVSQSGNGLAFAKFLLSATGSLVQPQISDGPRSLVFQETLEAGDTLEIDSDRRTAVRNGTESVLSLMSGDFPLLSPGETTLTYTDCAGSSHSGTLQITYRDLWV